jgi:acetylornithine aminotransferase/acetylornithine/N-succinyldiaminopimelate aminotransferase
MKEIMPPSPPIIHNQFESVKDLFRRHVVPSYGRFDLAFARGNGSYLWDVVGKRYLDLGGGIAVCALGHAHPEITQALIEQSQRLVHVSNLYYHEPQGRLAQGLVRHLAPGKVFFANSGGEANEGLFKLARRFGHNEGRFEILTALNSFHGRTLAGIAATGQDKVKIGFGPLVPGFRYVPFNDLAAARAAISPATAAILIEGIQGEGGITPATPEYLLGLRALCDEKKLLLLMDGVQCGYFRSGRFQSFQRILEGMPGGEAFLPDGISMAKSLGGGFPIGAFWVREPYADLLGPGSHATTFGGTPLACAVALKVLEVVERDRLADNARDVGEFLRSELLRLAAAHPNVIQAVRGLGFMLGFELAPKAEISAFANANPPAALQFVNRLHEAGLLTIPSGAQVVRLLPALNLTRTQAAEGIAIIENVVKSLAG